MGHLTLISEDVIGALEHYPPDLRLQLAQYAPQPAWDDYVGGRYRETKKKDTSLLGGGKPAVSIGGTRSVLRWKVDEEDAVAATGSDQTQVKQPPTEMKGEFRRTSKLSRESSADFGVGLPMNDDDQNGGPSQVRLSYSIILFENLILMNSSRDTWSRKFHRQLLLQEMTALMTTTKTRVGSPTLSLTWGLHLSQPGLINSFNDDR